MISYDSIKNCGSVKNTINFFYKTFLVTLICDKLNVHKIQVIVF